MTRPETLNLTTADGVAIEVLCYKGGNGAPAICIPGLTRNARDFEDFAPRLAASGRDVYVVSLRGRGRSAPDPNPANYFPTTYRDDILRLLDKLRIARAIFVGTSLGGIVTMLTNEIAPARVAAAIINDVGPELAPEGIARIGQLVGVVRSDAASLHEASSQIRTANESQFPGCDDEFWLTFARRTFRRSDDGRWILDYDQAIGKAMIDNGPAPDLWPAFTSLKDKPTLVIRGAISDLLTPPIIDKMRAVHPDFTLCKVANTGHAPTLSEPEVQASITSFLRAHDL